MNAIRHAKLNRIMQEQEKIKQNIDKLKLTNIKDKIIILEKHLQKLICKSQSDRALQMSLYSVRAIERNRQTILDKGYKGDQMIQDNERDFNNIQKTINDKWQHKIKATQSLIDYYSKNNNQ